MISARRSATEEASQIPIVLRLSPFVAPKVIAVSWVLSPSSAMKKMQKTARGANLILLSDASSSSLSFRRDVTENKKKQGRR